MRENRFGSEAEVVIIGAGPVGMVLAGELALAGVEVTVLERRQTPELVGSRAGGLQSRTIEVFDQRGIAERFLSQGTTAQVQGFAEVILDIGDFPTRHPYGLALWQNRIESILAGWIAELGVRVQYGSEVVGVEPGEAGVTVRRADGHAVRAPFVVGCDGGRSLVSTAAGIGFAGWDASVSNLIAEVEFGEEPEWGMRRDDRGTHGIGKLTEGGPTARVVVTEEQVRPGAPEPTLDDLRTAMQSVWGTDFAARSPTWISRFTDAARQATTYRAGRILLAGDAAHVHYPAGGQGLNIGVQDAVNLGWKLALVVKGRAPDALLDTYEEERYPVAAQVLRDSLARVGLRRADERSRAAREAMVELLAMEEARKRFGARLSGLGVRYEVRASGGTGSPGPAVHPLVGRRMPDLLLLVDGRPLQTYDLLHAARPVLLDLGAQLASEAAGPRPDLVTTVTAHYAGRWELPEIGDVTAPSAVLIRPDGYVAWVGDAADDALAALLGSWFGAVG